MNNQKFSETPFKNVFRLKKKIKNLKEDFDEDGFCNCCGWNSCFQQSHIEYCGYGNCEYIKKMYGEKTLKDLFDEEYN